MKRDQILARQHPVTQLLLELTGISLKAKDWPSIERFIQQRRNSLGGLTDEQYCDRLRASYADQLCPQPHTEWSLLIRQVTNGESYFFRDRDQLGLIAEMLLPELIAARRQAFRQGLIDRRYLNLWSAGCSTGEEPYSLMMLLRDHLPDWQDWRIHLIATDINPQAIAHARKGLYRDWSLRETGRQYRHRYFQPVDKGWQIDPKLTSSIQWDVLNLHQDDAIAQRIPWATMDLIVCRNVFIYFDPDAIAKILRQFHQRLNPEGFLVVGHAELEGQDLSTFRLRREANSVIYQRVQTQASPPSESLQLKPNPQESMVRSMVAAHSEQKHSEQRARSPLAETDQASLEELETLLERDFIETLTAKLAQFSAPEQQHYKIQWILATLAYAKADWPLAQHHGQLALQNYPEHIPSMLLLADVKIQGQQWNRALSYLRRILYLEPEHWIAHLKLADLYLQLENFKKAKKIFSLLEDLLRSIPDDQKVKDRHWKTVGQIRAYLTWAKLQTQTSVACREIAQSFLSGKTSNEDQLRN